MPITRPTLSDIVARMTTDIQTAAGLATPLLPNSLLRTLAKVAAGGIHMLYGYIQYFSRQTFPDTAESAYLDRWASVWGVTREAATYAACTLTVTGVDTSAIPAGTLWISASGIEYASDADAVIDGATAVPVTATTAGAMGTPIAGDTPGLVAPVAGVDASATVAALGITNGVDTESDAALLTRLLARIQTPPQGGALTDYVAWARTVAGVTRAWAYPGMYGAGSVGVTFVCDGQMGGPIPSGGTVTEVQTAIDALRPVTAAVTVFAPTASPVAFTITGLSGASADVKAAIAAALQSYVEESGFPASVLLLTRFIMEIAENSQGADFELTIPAANFVVGAGQIATMGAITWA